MCYANLKDITCIINCKGLHPKIYMGSSHHNKNGDACPWIPALDTSKNQNGWWTESQFFKFFHIYNTIIVGIWYIQQGGDFLFCHIKCFRKNYL